jgi:signal transduction histidine kinase
MRLNTRSALLAGFGGLLLLMAGAGFNAVRVVRQIQTRNEAIRRDFLARNDSLEQIRGDVYLSGTYVRDYLLEPDPGNAEKHRNSLDLTRRDMDAALHRYEGLLSPGEVRPFEVLKTQLETYWQVLDPVFQWNVEQRHVRGYAFLRDEVFPRRMAMLGLADQIAAVSRQQLRSGNQLIASLFDQFSARLIGIIGLTLVLGLCLAAFCVSKILGLEKEAAQRYQEIAHARQELKELSARLVEAQEEERRAISRDLHDEVGQSLYAVLVELRNLSALTRTCEDGELQSHVDLIKMLVETSMSTARNMALLLRPSMLDDLGLLPAVEWQAREVSKRAGIRVDVAAERLSDDLPEEHKTCIYRVVQEALHNCSKHAEADVVRITIRQEANRLLLLIQDNGKGFRPSRGHGLGLLGMEERVSHLGGLFRVESKQQQGTLIRVELPMETPNETPVQRIG